MTVYDNKKYERKKIGKKKKKRKEYIHQNIFLLFSEKYEIWLKATM